MKATIILLTLLAFLLPAAAQAHEPRQTVCRDGVIIGNVFDKIEPDTDADGAYMVDTLRVLSQSVAVYIPVFVQWLIDGTAKYSPVWTAHITKEDREQRISVLEFDSYISGDSYYLMIEETGSSLRVAEAVMLWASTTYHVNTGTKEEPDIMTLYAIRILRKKINTTLNGVIVFDNYFIDADGFDSYYLPRKYTNDLELCLEFMKRRHQFLISDFEQGQESLQQFGIADRKLKQ